MKRISIATAIFGGLSYYVYQMDPTRGYQFSSEGRSVSLRNNVSLGILEVIPQKGKKDYPVVFVFPESGGSRLELASLGLAGSARLQALDARIIVVERPGMGISSGDVERSLLDWPLWISQLADELGVREFSVAGLGSGGMYALACAYWFSRFQPGKLRHVGLI